MNKPDFKCTFINALKIAMDCLVAKLTVTAARRLDGDGRRLANAVKIAIGVMSTQELNDLKAQTVCGSVQNSVFTGFACPNSGVFNPMGRCANTTCTTASDGKDGFCCSAKPLCTKSFVDGATVTAGKMNCGAGSTVKTTSTDRCADLVC